MSATAAVNTDAFIGRPFVPAFDRTRAATLSSPGALSPRELQVLGLLANGYRTSEIALELAYSERTIKHSIAALTTRLQLRNRTQAVAMAVREGLI